MSKRLLPIALSTLFVFGVRALAATPELASMDWSVKAPENLASHPPSEQVIDAFMSHLDALGDDAGATNGVCSAHFADLENSGDLSLVVTRRFGRFCGLEVVDKVAGGFKMYSFDMAHYADGPEIKDLVGNGRLELTVPTDLTDYQGANYCVAQWPTTYAWIGNGYSNVSSQYNSYYERQLASLKKQIAAAETQEEEAERPSVSKNAESSDIGADGIMTPAGLTPHRYPALEGGRSGLNCAEAEAAKMERFLGISSDAGMSEAIKLANSNDPYDREFAINMFADMATPEAQEHLRTLSHDSSRSVSDVAKAYLHGQASSAPEVDEEFIPEKPATMNK